MVDFPIILHWIGTVAKNAEYDLKKALLREYRNDVRPVRDDRDALDLKLEIGLQQIINVVSIILFGMSK